MTINEKTYYQLTTDLIKFYRVEGGKSFHHFNLDENQLYNFGIQHYIFFSKSIEHHKYYIRKRLQQLINMDILENTNFRLHSRYLLNPNSFKEIINIVEDYPLDDRILSIEFSLSQIFDDLLKQNYITNTKKKTSDKRTERVDTTKYQGGYGFCDKWLEVFNIFTYFYSYQRITKENIFDFLYVYRFILSKNKMTIDPTSFFIKS